MRTTDSRNRSTAIQRWRVAAASLVSVLYGCLAIATTTVPIHAFAEENAATKVFRTDVAPVLRKFCFDCHADGADEGGLDLKSLKVEDLTRWHAVWSNVKHDLMPPSDAESPKLAERQAILDWIETYVMRLEPEHPDPGAVTIRRLNREEYRWTIRDLFDVDYRTELHFAPDDSGYGFDTVGDTQSVAPILSEKYLNAARTIADLALPASRSDRRSKSHQRLLFDGPPPKDEGKRQAYRREVIQQVADAAFRRPVDAPTLKRITTLSAKSDDGSEAGFEDSIRTAITILLISPRFLFRAETEKNGRSPEDSKAIPIDDYALASRMSYFLWSTAPDKELRDLAASGKLREQIRPQVDRLVLDPKADRFYENFVGQWLRVRDVLHWDIEPEAAVGRPARDAQRIFNYKVRRAMQSETYELFEYLMDENRSLRELLVADYTFLNDELARFYRLPNVRGQNMRKVDLPKDGIRRGILTHGSILLVTSNPTRTSPVKRGVFVLDNILGTPASPAPPDVPELIDKKKDGKELTMRERMEIHRSEALCASCHSRMDPMGLAFESFNIAGRFRKELDGKPIDTAGQLITGENFEDLRELAEVLANDRRDDFYRCLTEKMLTYAIGRGVEYYDITTIDKIVAALKKDDGKARTLIYEIVESAPFQMRRGINYRPAISKRNVRLEFEKKEASR